MDGTSTHSPAEGLAIARPPGYGLTRARTLVARFVPALPWQLCAITALAAALRFAELEDVVGNPFYDASVHAMGLSWHNFFFGAFDPGALLSVDKPPLDLWLQVASVKALGWNMFALKLPEAVGGTLAVPLLYDAVRRVFGRGAGIAAAIALAVTPVSVLTSRSDTMDSLMMLCVVGALWLTVRATERGRRGLLVLAGVALGLAFNVKLAEGLLAAPALALLYALAAPLGGRRRATDIALAGAALVVVSLSWAVAVSLASGPHPFPIGSANGTVFDAIFGFNALSRVSGVLAAGGVYAAPPGVLRLFNGVGSIGRLFGVMLVAALALGAAAAVVEWRRSARAEPPRSRLAFAFSLAVLVWLACGVALLSYVSVLHARYLEMVTPAVAIVIGGALASLVDALRADGEPRVAIPALVAALAGVCWYSSTLVAPSVGRAAGLAVLALIAAVIAASEPRVARSAAVLAGALALGCCLSFPIRESLALVRSARSDSVGLPVAPRAVEAAIGRYLGPRTQGMRYELATDDALALAPLMIHDSRPVLPLTTFAARPFLGLPELEQAVRSGQVRYALVGRYSCAGGRVAAACIPTSIWVREHGLDVSAQVPIPRSLRLKLYFLPQ
ncbi:MAG TPA: glycosyltransferase family 39 protein [Solirubrobacteraceae bacterium]|jgi:4-amino-4-deoxy-L-arabinose transferase-like glycosyltransferase|nr:glycosyltransferase family 39 protein [Solirubrobacteraceae bacterium]